MNDYLASYQSELMGRIYRFGDGNRVHRTDQQPAERRNQYNADITYGTNNEFGFDYICAIIWRGKKPKTRPPEHHYAIVDEVDSISMRPIAR